MRFSFFRFCILASVSAMSLHAGGPDSRDASPDGAGSGTAAEARTADEGGGYILIAGCEVPLDVKALDLSELGLTELPKEIGLLTSLQTLHLWGNQLTELPGEIGGLANLQSLCLEYNELTAAPIEIGQLSNLQMLDLGHNRLTTLPSAIRGLSNLQMLDLGHNRLTTLPSAIRGLTNLHTLHLSGNPLTVLRVPTQISPAALRFLQVQLDASRHIQTITVPAVTEGVTLNLQNQALSQEEKARLAEQAIEQGWEAYGGGNDLTLIPPAQAADNHGLVMSVAPFLQAFMEVWRASGTVPYPRLRQLMDDPVFQAFVACAVNATLAPPPAAEEAEVVAPVDAEAGAAAAAAAAPVVEAANCPFTDSLRFKALRVALQHPDIYLSEQDSAERFLPLRVGERTFYICKRSSVTPSDTTPDARTVQTAEAETQATSASDGADTPTDEASTAAAAAAPPPE
jgi:hypothetical protein